jgi:type IV pilus assembly protein PilV
MPIVTQRPAAAQRGFSLIEVLVAMLILAIGLLGLAALQTQGVRFNHDAYVRTSATVLAYDIVDKMRLNRGNQAGYVTANFPVRNAEPVGGYSVENPPYNCTGAGATVVSVAVDLACWLNGIELGLPLGRAFIDQQAAPNDDLFDITIMWLDREPREFGIQTRLAQTQAECEAITNRVWADPPAQCFVTQTWTVWP